MTEATAWVKWPEPGSSRTSRRSCCPDAERLELNEGKEISLVPGLERLRREVFEVLDYDTVVVLDSHWHTTVEFVVAAQPVRAGLFTSDELPRGMCRIPYDWRGNPELAQAMAAQADAHGTWITAIDDPCLPVHYATVNLWSYLGRGLDRRWVSVSTAQTGETEDFLRVGRALGAAIAASGGRVLLIASGAMSHTFWSLRELRAHEASDPAHIRTAAARGADSERIGWLAGRRPRPGDRDHAGVPEVPAGGQVRPVPDDDRGAGRGGGHRARPGLQRVRELGRHRADAYLVRPARGRVDWTPRSRHDRIPADPAGRGRASRSCGTGTNWWPGTGAGWPWPKRCTCRRACRPRSWRCT